MRECRRTLPHTQLTYRPYPIHDSFVCSLVSGVSQLLDCASMAAAELALDEARLLLTELAPGIAAWTAAYLVCRHVLCRRRSADFANRVVSTAHALLAIVLSVPALDWSQPLATVGQPNTAAQARRRGSPSAAAEPPPTTLQTLCMSVSLAYFVYDFFICLVIEPEVVGTVHHLCTMAGLVVGVVEKKARRCRRLTAGHGGAAAS